MERALLYNQRNLRGFKLSPPESYCSLGPTNIFMDYNMVPQITDFGISRCFDEKQGCVITSKVMGSMGLFCQKFSVE